MRLTRTILVLCAIMACMPSTNARLYVPSSCVNTCANPSDFIGLLPVETGPVGLGGNRAYAWAITGLIQSQINVRSLSPPGSARVSAIIGSCLYEAAALAENNEGFHTGWKGKSDAAVDIMDGAGVWALFSIFGDRSSFSRVFSDYEVFSGKNDLPFLLANIQSTVGFSSKKLIVSKRFATRGRTAAVLAGAAACQKVISKYTADGFRPDGTLGNQPDPTDYTPVNLPQVLAGITDCETQIIDPGRWQPLCVPNENGEFGTEDCTVQEFLAPFAGRYTTFALEEGDETTGDTLVFPPTMPESEQFRQEAAEVLEISGRLGDEEKVIAEYWADGPDKTTPPLHLWKIAADAALYEDLSTSETANLLFIIGNALYDAGIASWRSKTTFDFPRPIQMIQCGEFRGTERDMWLGPYMGVGTASVDEWRPFQAETFVTPAFAGFTSGHSTFTEAFSVAMRKFFGNDKYRGPACYLSKEGESFFEPRKDDIPGVTDIPNTGPRTVGYVPGQDLILCWDTWTEASDQSGDSRLFGGIHVRIDDDGGKFMGENAGEGAFAKATSLKFPSDF